MRIFVSYTLRDKVLSIEILRYIEVFFSNLGIPYIDVLHNNSPAPQEHVISTLNQSEVFCALITPKYFESNWTRLELNIATRRGMPIALILLSEKTNHSY